MPDEILNRAVRAYFRRFGGGAPVPADKSEIVTIDGSQVVILRNAAGGELARFKIDRGGSLRHIARHMLGELKPLGWSECVDEWPIHADKERKPAGSDGE